MPAWLQRDDSKANQTGTTLSILGFVPSKDWERILAASIAESFFGAILRGNLEVEITDGPTLTAATLPEIFEDKEIVGAISDQKEEPETFQNSGHFLRALSSTESETEDTQNAALGHCRLHILVGEGLPKKVAILRNGMLITSELPGLRRFGEFKEFAAVLECLSEKGNSLLRDMEPPAHDNFEPARLAAPPQQRVGRIALREVAAWVREMLQRHAQDPVAEVTEIDELAEFFGDDETTGDKGSRDGDENPRGALKIRARPLPKKKASTTSDDPGNEPTGAGGSGKSGDDDGEGEGDSKGNTGGGGANDSEGGNTSSGGSGGGKSTSASTLSLRNVRAVVLGPSRRRIAFTPQSNGEIKVELEDSGADTNRLLRVKSTSSGEIADGRLKLSCIPNTRVVIDVELDRAFEGTIRVKANAV